MSDPLDEATVRHVAHLSRLALSDEEVHQFATQLADILGYVAQLNEVETQDVPPTAHAIPVSNVFRKDEPAEGLSVEQALSNAPARQQDFFKVPKVLNPESA